MRKFSTVQWFWANFVYFRPPKSILLEPIFFYILQVDFFQEISPQKFWIYR